MMPETRYFPLSFDFRGPNWASESPVVGDSTTLSFVVQPHEFDEFGRLPDNQIWWFLDSLANHSLRDLESAGNLRDHAEHSLKIRRSCFQMKSVTPLLVVVPNELSAKWVESIGVEALVLPPPVNDSLYGLRSAGNSAILNLGPPSVYADLFLETLHEGVVTTLDLEDADSAVEQLASYSAGLGIGPDAGGGFPYQAAVHLAAGHALLAQRLFPLHGLESGIDYLDFTSPEELFHVIEYLKRSPEALHLMRFRGQQKAAYFRGSSVWPRVLERLNSSYPNLVPSA